MDDFNQQLSLVVLNSEQLDGSQQVQYRFDEMGGTLGASEQDDWQLRDRLGAVMPAHARIELNDGRFCLCDFERPDLYQRCHFAHRAGPQGASGAGGRTRGRSVPAARLSGGHHPLSRACNRCWAIAPPSSSTSG
ncbi:hypothetical protein [Aeromonas molluscorum]|uniref:hypothetical protein n=1 Tax=Aeromonas molluscorum TaxID=271417 RepID=UPI003F19E648